MFIRFGFENDYCFRDRQEISFLAEKPTGHSKYRLSCPGTTHGLVPVVTVFGANASGKSNALNAVGSLAHLVRNSHARLQEGDPIPRTPFRLDPAAREAPTRYDCDLMLEDEEGGLVRHHFGVVFDDQRVHEEWLYAWPNGTRRILFHRTEGAADPWYFGPSLKGKKRDLASFTRQNTLFLSAAAQNNHRELGRIASAISRGMLSAYDGEPPKGFLLGERAPVLSMDHRDLVVDLLRAADLGVTDLRQESQRTQLEEALKALPEDEAGRRTRKRILAQLAEGGAPMAIELQHEGAEPTWFNLDDESRGTRRLLLQLNPVISALQQGALLLADELEEALHPKLCAKLIGLFESPVSNPRGAQLLFTTHHDALLEDRTRDEVLLADKDRDGAARLTPLTDFHLRPRDNLRRAYVEGRVGGVPRIGNVERLFAEHRSAR